MDLTGLYGLSGTEAARSIREGRITAVELVQACLARIREVDGAVQAWTFLDPEHALAYHGSSRRPGTLGRGASIRVLLRDVRQAVGLLTPSGRCGLIARP